MENKEAKRERNNNYDCFYCHADMMIEREHLFHYIMGAAMYRRATAEQIEKLIDCYARIYSNLSADIEFLRLVNAIEQQQTTCKKS